MLNKIANIIRFVFWVLVLIIGLLLNNSKAEDVVPIVVGGLLATPLIHSLCYL